MDDVTQRAIAAIGFDSERTDWELNPRGHAAILQPEAGPLKRILARPEVLDVVSTYKSDDVSAVGYQKIHRKLARLHTWARFAEIAARPIAIVIAIIFASSLFRVGDVTGTA
jgi:hypothetical protein